jgi:transcriptional regulator with XRE-family HTH domain
MGFGEKLKELRINLNYSQKDLSDQTGLTIRTIQRIENNKVKPSLYSLKVIGEALKIDLTEHVNKAESKPYEFSFTIKITDMNQLFNDIKILVKNNWKILIWIILIIFFVSSYKDIKSGFTDAWTKEKSTTK